MSDSAKRYYLVRVVGFLGLRTHSKVIEGLEAAEAYAEEQRGKGRKVEGIVEVPAVSSPDWPRGRYDHP